MNIAAHAGLGWLLAEAGHADVRFRRAVFLAAVLPDVDGITYVLGSLNSLDQHHVWAHNMLFSLLVSGCAAWYCRHMIAKTLLFTQISFYSHYFGDYFFTQWPLAYLWPISNERFVASHAYPYYSNINTALMIAGVVVIAVLAVRFRRTPIEVLSQRLDSRFVNAITEAVTKPFGTRK